MKRLILVLLVIAVNGAAQIPESQRTHGRLNGRWWESLSGTLKIGFVSGYATAVEDWELTPYMAIIAAQCTERDRGYKLLADAQGLMFPKEPIFDDVVKGLDRLYAEPENLPLPINSALRVLSMKFRSEKTENIDAELRRLRIEATKDK